MSGLKKSLKERKEKKPLSHGWIVVPSKTYPDRVYFYNTVTKCSTWNNPCEVINDKEYDSSSESSSPERYRLHKTKSFVTSYKKQKNKTVLQSSDQNSNIKINSEIEDYDEQQDQYFDNIPINAFSLSHSKIISPSSSPDSNSHSDSDKHSDSNMLLEDNKKQLWVHFLSSPEKPIAKKSVALSDIDKPSTSSDLGMETYESERNKLLPKGISINKKQDCVESRTFNESDKKGVKKKKRGKKKKTEQCSKNNSGKTIKNVLFKRSDKTPAQTRLLKLRTQNAEKLKELASKYPDFIPRKSDTDECLKAKNYDFLNLEETKVSDSFGDAYFKRIEICSNVSQETDNHSEVDYSEEMDWEPSTEESDVRNINVFRQQIDKASEVSSDVFFGLNSDHPSNLPSKTHSWILVLDTNIFVSCLGFVKGLRDTQVPEFGYPIIYVPWRVLQELDHLKDTKIDTVHKNLHVNVRKAIAYLNENFKMRHPRIFGQSFEDFANMVDVETSAPDDEILQTCIQVQKQHTDKRLMLLTNDKNLESKAIVSGVDAYSKDSFQKKFLTSNSVSPEYTDAVNISSNELDKIDECYCAVKAILKEFISSVVEAEMKVAFEADWVKLAFKKPPWTLQDAMDCLLKHWRSVFFLNFSKDTHAEAERLYNKLFKRKTANVDDVIEIIRSIQRLILHIKRLQKNKRPYMDLIPITTAKLSDVMISLSSNHSSRPDNALSTSLVSSVSMANDFFSGQSVSQDEASISDVSKVKIFFKDIWDSLRSFCCSISDVIRSSAANDDTKIQEIRLKVSQILNEVGELVTIVEKLLEINVSDINERHSLIVYFSNFLIRVYPAMVSDVKHELPKCLAAFFTDFEGRSLLSRSLNDFREFIQDLLKAVEYFNTTVEF